MSACYDKVALPSEEIALKVLAKQQAKAERTGKTPPKHAYRCPECLRWHLSSWPSGNHKDSWALYRCFSCPALFYTHQELSEHRSSHAHPDEDFWTWYYRRWAA